MGGLEPARSLILRAIAAGKPVVTANKAVIARYGEEIAAAAAAKGLDWSTLRPQLKKAERWHVETY
jgi:homoserine dehydrogenase